MGASSWGGHKHGIWVGHTWRKLKKKDVFLDTVTRACLFFPSLLVKLRSKVVER